MVRAKCSGALGLLLTLCTTGLGCSSEEVAIVAWRVDASASANDGSGFDATTATDLAATDLAAPACTSGCGCLPDGSPCDDGNACTEGDTCAAGTCAPGKAKACVTTDACSLGSCAPATGCVWSSAPDDTPCSDGSACTSGDVCKSGTCAGKALVCDDGNPCTADTCDLAGGCLWTPTPVPCNDGNACTQFDVCANGQCAGLPIAVSTTCDDGNPCTVDVCVPALGCDHSSAEGACDDGNPCTVGDACKSGLCIAGTWQCTCSTDKDCAALGSDNLCAGKWVCDKSSGPWTCKVNPATAVVCPPTGLACQKAVCSPSTGQCVSQIETGACETGLPCAPGQCVAGKCVAGQSAICDDGNPCTTDACAATGCTATAVADGQTCGPKLQCMGGKCVSACNLGEQITGTTAPDDLLGVVGTTDGGFVAVGRSGGDGWVVRYNGFGVQLWSLTLGSPTQPETLRDIVTSPPGKLIAVGDAGMAEQATGWVVALDFNGKVLWQQFDDGIGPHRFNGVAQVGSDGVLAVGQADDSGPAMVQGRVVRYGGDGTVLWAKNLGFQSNDSLTSAVYAGTNFFVGGFGFTSGKQGDADGWLARLTDEAPPQVAWSQLMGGEKYQRFTRVLPSGVHLYAVGDTNAPNGSSYDGVLTAVKWDGTVEWTQVYGGPKDDRFAGATSFAGGIIAVGGSDSGTNGDYDGWLVRLDGSGKPMWQKKVGGKFNDRFAAAAPLTTGGVVVVGTTETPLPGLGPSQGNGWILRIDSAADSACK
jgi:hypothetical protein